MTITTKLFIGFCIAFVVIIGLLLKDTTSTTRLFCAYGTVFVEFEDPKHTWGTLMLDSNGKPIPCYTDENIEIVRQQGVTI
jgi:hypothetical protein